MQKGKYTYIVYVYTYIGDYRFASEAFGLHQEPWPSLNFGIRISFIFFREKLLARCLLPLDHLVSDE